MSNHSDHPARLVPPDLIFGASGPAYVVRLRPDKLVCAVYDGRELQAYLYDGCPVTGKEDIQEIRRLTAGDPPKASPAEITYFVCASASADTWGGE